jgi:hypothetical protein
VAPRFGPAPRSSPRIRLARRWPISIRAN